MTLALTIGIVIAAAVTLFIVALAICDTLANTESADNAAELAQTVPVEQHAASELAAARERWAA